MSIIESVFKKIKEHKLEKALLGLTINIFGNISSYKTNAKGEYSGRGIINIYNEYEGKIQREYTLIHEIGHRYYYEILPNEKRKQWESFYNTHDYKITNENIEQLKKSMSILYQKEKPKREKLDVALHNLYRYIDDPILKIIIVNSGNPHENIHNKYLYIRGVKNSATDILQDTYFEIRDKFDWFHAEYDIQFGYIDKNEWDETTKLLINKLKEVTFNLSAVTGYSNYNESEAYAESFTLWCLDKPMQALVNDMFTRVSLLR